MLHTECQKQVLLFRTNQSTNQTNQPNQPTNQPYFAILDYICTYPPSLEDRMYRYLSQYSSALGTLPSSIAYTTQVPTPALLLLSSSLLACPRPSLPRLCMPSLCLSLAPLACLHDASFNSPSPPRPRPTPSTFPILLSALTPPTSHPTHTDTKLTAALSWLPVPSTPQTYPFPHHPPPQKNPPGQ